MVTVQLMILGNIHMTCRIIIFLFFYLQKRFSFYSFIIVLISFSSNHKLLAVSSQTAVWETLHYEMEDILMESSTSKKIAIDAPGDLGAGNAISLTFQFDRLSRGV